MAESAAASPIGERVKFENPPINELVVAMFHLPVSELRAQHIGLYWSEIRQRYPHCEQQVPITQEVFETQPGEVLPLPRFWFSDRSKPSLIQVQRNAFIFNWRRVPDVEYPHYETVARTFWREFDGYKAFIEGTVGGKLDVVQRCELTYVNVINANAHFQQLPQLGNILPSVSTLAALQTDSRKLALLNVSAGFRINSTILAELTIRGGKSSPDATEPTALLELKAHGAPPDLSLRGARDWYDAAHDAIYRLFLDATDERIQKEIWRPR
jgi:uncharacterized protein (TIGR04255 family)